jgi:hypothetical protein
MCFLYYCIRRHCSYCTIYDKSLLFLDWSSKAALNKLHFFSQSDSNIFLEMESDSIWDILCWLMNNLGSFFLQLYSPIGWSVYIDELWIYDISLRRGHFCSQVLLHGSNFINVILPSVPNKLRCYMCFSIHICFYVFHFCLLLIFVINLCNNMHICLQLSNSLSFLH